MIRVQVSEIEFRWILPHKIIHVREIPVDDGPFDPYMYRHSGAGWFVQKYFSVRPRSTIIYESGFPSCPDWLHTMETPEQIADMVRAAMPMVSIASKT